MNLAKERVISAYPVACILALVFLTGCARDRSLSPPPDSEVITITVKVPRELEAEVINVMYRSAICTSIRHDGNGRRNEIEGHHGIDVQLQREGHSDLYTARLPIEGGGRCKWRLSNATFGVKYIEPTRFGDNVRYGHGGGLIVMFDPKRSPIGVGRPIRVEGDLVVKKDYYPWIHEGFLGRYKKTVNLTGQGDIHVGYLAETARYVYFEPVLHHDFVVYSAGPKVKKPGNYPVYTYPDGTVLSQQYYYPNFNRLQNIRLGIEARP